MFRKSVKVDRCNRVFILICIAILLGGNIFAADPQQKMPEGTAQFAGKLDSVLPSLLTEFLVPGAAVALIENGQVVFSKGYGFADLSKQLQVTPVTGFNIGSISKTVAAWGVMRLVDQGKLDLDAPVKKYLTRWQLPDSEFDASGVTVRRLLSHTAGLSLHGYPGFGPADELPTVEASLSGATNGPGDVRLIMDPGTRWKYSGGGYTLSQLLVEEVSGQRFAEFVYEQVLKPLGMDRSDYRLTPEIMAGSSMAYDGWSEPTPNPRFTAEAAAGLHSTVLDLAAFACAALPGPNGEMPGRDILKPETVALMLKPASEISSNYGLGYGISTLPDGKTTTGHSGSNRGWNAFMRVIPETGQGIVILTNGSNGGALLQQMYCHWSKFISGTLPEGGCKTPIGIVLTKTIINDGIEAAIRQYRDLKKNHPDDYHFWESQLNRLGYGLLSRKQVADAIEIFKLNVEMFPEAFNPYDSLGEAYMINGDKKLAIKNYQKSYELNPENTHALDMVKKMQAELQTMTSD